MKKFRFPLETLLRLKTRQEEQARQQYMVCQANLRQAEQVLRGLTGKYEALVGEIRDLQVSRTKIRTVQLFRVFVQKLQAEITEQKQVVQTCQDAVNASRKRLVEARRERLILEKLKEKRVAEYRLAMLREEQLLIDEVAGRLSGRQGSGN